MSDPSVRFQELLKSSGHDSPRQKALVTFDDWFLNTVEMAGGEVQVSGSVTIASTSSNPITFAGISVQASGETFIAQGTAMGDQDADVPLGTQVIITAMTDVYDVAAHGSSLMAIAGGSAVNSGTYSSPYQHFTVGPQQPPPPAPGGSSLTSDPVARFQQLLNSSGQAPAAEEDAVAFTAWNLSTDETSVPGEVAVYGTVTITSTSSDPLTFAGINVVSSDSTIIALTTVMGDPDYDAPIAVQVILDTQCNVYQVATHGTSLLVTAGAYVNGIGYVSPVQHYTVQTS